jgi:hypothetical protein
VIGHFRLSIVRQIEKKVAEAKTENTFQELVIEGTLELGMAPEKEITVLEKWAKRRGLEVGQFIGPPIYDDELQRTRRKIFTEQKQLPTTTPNLLVIRSNSLLSFGTGDTKTVETVIGELEECVYQFPQILFTVLNASYMGSIPRTTHMKGQHLYISKTRKDEMGEQLIILLNRYCDFKISPATISRVYQAFGEY